MNNSPFEVFRRNLKPLMVFLTGLALFAFVVLPVLDQYMRQNAGTRNEQIVATFDGQKLTRERAEGFTRGHQVTLAFLRDLADRTVNSGREPLTAGWDPNQQGAMGLGINPEPSLEGSIRTFVFAGQATKQGFALSDSELSVWLEQFCDGIYSEAELNSLAKKISSNSMNLPMIKEQLRLHMLAQVFINRGYAGLRITTPDQTWRSFQKLNRRATANTYGVLVNDYLDEAKKLALDSEAINELYKEGKDRFNNPDSSEFGFRQRYSAKFQYVSGSAENFMADEISKLTEEQLRAAYEEEKKAESARLTLPPESGAEPEAEPKADPAAEPTAEPAAEPKAEPAAEPKAEPAAEPKAEPAAEPKAEAAAEPKAEPAAEPKAEPAEGDSSKAFQSNAIRLVSTQDQGGEPNGAPVADDKPADDKPADDKPADIGAEQPPVAKEPTIGTFEEERARLERKLALPGAQKRLDDAMRSIFKEMQSAFNKYSIDSGMANNEEELTKASKKMQESKLVETLAESYGLTFEEIGPDDEITIRDEPISESSVRESSVRSGSGMLQSGPGFVQMMYTLTRNGEPEKPLYSPLLTARVDFMDPALSKQYVSWKVAEKAANTPTLDEVRDQVVEAWRLTKARELATAAANKIAASVNSSPEATLASSVPEDKKEDFLKEGLPAFQWMNPTFSPRMMQLLQQFPQAAQGMTPDSATIGNVRDLDNVGEDFMKAVFTASVNEAKTAMNRSGTVVYVVQPTEFMPSQDVLHEQFKQPRNRMSPVLRTLSERESVSVLNGFFESVDKDAGYTNKLLEDQ